ncbi:MAG: DUF2840 domain-containing protein [Deltaproteobacteria bacterium]|nr:DUF2840 domain-containing protein [Deltaproteobacteria bacterium]
MEPPRVGENYCPDMDIQSVPYRPLSIAQPVTRVEELYLEGQKNFRLLFGKPIKSETTEFKYQDITRRVHYFKPGDIFAIDLWERNEYGTTSWSVFVLQAALPGEFAVRIPQVKPAAKVLLEAAGQKHAREAVRLLKEIEDRTDPTKLHPSRFLLTDFRLKAEPSNFRRMN